MSRRKESKVVLGMLLPSGKPAPTTYVTLETLDNIQGVPWPYDWMSFYYPEGARVITVGKIKRINHVWDAKAQGLWV